MFEDNLVHGTVHSDMSLSAVGRPPAIEEATLGAGSVLHPVTLVSGPCCRWSELYFASFLHWNFIVMSLQGKECICLPLLI
jgi:hypothetical protein